MKKIFSLFSITVMLLTFITSCSSDILEEKEPIGQTKTMTITEKVYSSTSNIYARVEFKVININSDIVTNTYEEWDYDCSNIVYFYSSTTNQRITLTEPITLQITKYIYDDDRGHTSSTQTGARPIPAGTSSYSLGNTKWTARYDFGNCTYFNKIEFGVSIL